MFENTMNGNCLSPPPTAHTATLLAPSPNITSAMSTPITMDDFVVDNNLRNGIRVSDTNATGMLGGLGSVGGTGPIGSIHNPSATFPSEAHTGKMSSTGSIGGMSKSGSVGSRGSRCSVGSRGNSATFGNKAGSKRGRSSLATNMNTMNNMSNGNNRKMKRRSSDKCIVSGRSLKRLRLDPNSHSQSHPRSHSRSHSGSVGAMVNTVSIPNNSNAAAASEAAGNYPAISSAQSTGTLSVGTVGTLGTMGADLESNDEDDGEEEESGIHPLHGTYDEDDNDEDDDIGSERSGSAASSWVASLPSLSSHNFRRRRCVPLNGGFSNPTLEPSPFVVSMQPSLHPNGIAPSAMNAMTNMPYGQMNTTATGGGNEEEDDAATCAAMTTAAVAPKRHRRNSPKDGRKERRGGRDNKRRAIGFTLDGEHVTSTNMASSAGYKNDHFVPLKSALKEDDGMDDLGVEDIDVDSILLDGKEVTIVANQHSNPPLHENLVENRTIDNQREGLRSQLSMTPPIDCIPDPLLLAAQHAAGGGNGMTVGARMVSEGKVAGGKVTSFQIENNADTAASATSHAKENGNTNWSLLLMGDCCSSVTEEETSLAEDEASLSAISIGGNTTMSAGMSAGGDAGTPGASVAAAASAAEQGETLAEIPERGGNDGSVPKSAWGSGASLTAGGLDNPIISGLSDVKPASEGKACAEALSTIMGMGRSNFRGADQSIEDFDPNSRFKTAQTFKNHSLRALHNDDNAVLQQGGSFQEVTTPKFGATSSLKNPIVASNYSSLNHLLGGLHKERQGRRSLHLESNQKNPSIQRLSSLLSVGSDCPKSGQGMGQSSLAEDGSYRSCPGNIPVASGPSISVTIPLHQMQQLPSETHLSANSATAMMEDVEMGGTDPSDNIKMGTSTGWAGSITGGGSIHSAGAASLHGSQTGSWGNISQNSSVSGSIAMANGEDGKSGRNSAPRVPRWKQQVKLPSHSSLY